MKLEIKPSEPASIQLTREAMSKCIGLFKLAGFHDREDSLIFQPIPNRKIIVIYNSRQAYVDAVLLNSDKSYSYDLFVPFVGTLTLGA